MRIRLYVFLIAAAMAIVITTARAEQTNAASVATSHFQFGETLYPTSLYPAGANSYFIEDKGGTAADASIVFRDQGNARAEIGIVEDNDIHIKTVAGAYGSEVFTDRLLIRASGGEVDSFGTLLRQYATSGRPTIIAGNSDLSTGAGLELAYDQDSKQASISSVDHGNGYRNLIINSNGVQFFQGENSVSQIAGISNKGLVTAPAVVSGGAKFTISGCSVGMTVGGAAAGTFKAGVRGRCKVVITMNGDTGMSAPHGWACSGNNLTSSTHLIHQVSSTPTTATLAVKTAINDIISFYCMGY